MSAAVHQVSVSSGAHGLVTKGARLGETHPVPLCHLATQVHSKQACGPIDGDVLVCQCANVPVCQCASVPVTSRSHSCGAISFATTKPATYTKQPTSHIRVHVDEGCWAVGSTTAARTRVGTTHTHACKCTHAYKCHGRTPPTTALTYARRAGRHIHCAHMIALDGKTRTSEGAFRAETRDGQVGRVVARGCFVKRGRVVDRKPPASTRVTRTSVPPCQKSA